jgi:hypothetical protein
MKTREPLSTLEQAKRLVARASADDKQADLLINRLLDEYRYPGQPPEALRMDWAPKRLANWEQLKLIIPRIEDQMTGHPSVLVDDGTTL